MIVVFAILLVLFGSVGCQCPPRLTAEGRRSDIDFLTRRVRDCHQPAEAFFAAHRSNTSQSVIVPPAACCCADSDRAAAKSPYAD